MKVPPGDIRLSCSWTSQKSRPSVPQLCGLGSVPPTSPRLCVSSTHGRSRVYPGLEARWRRRRRAGLEGGRATTLMHDRSPTCTEREADALSRLRFWSLQDRSGRPGKQRDGTETEPHRAASGVLTTSPSGPILQTLTQQLQDLRPAHCSLRSWRGGRHRFAVTGSVF